METRFYCDKCSRDVAFNTEVCPYCGEVFNAVKCPVCKLIGKPRLFINGCPSCGFMQPGLNGITTKRGDKKKKKQKRFTLGSGRKKKKLFIYIPPIWYKVAIVIFIIILIFLVYLVFKLY